MAQRISRPNGLPGAALVDRSARGKLVVSGADRRSYLHALLTNDIAALSAGHGCYAAYLTPQGRMIADMRVFDLGDVLLLDVDAGVKDSLLQQFDQFVFSEDVRFGDVTEAFAEAGVYGPGSAQPVADALRLLGAQAPGAAALAGLPEYANARLEAAGQAVVLAASRDFAELGFDLFCERALADRLRRALVEAGADEVPAEVADAMRIERGRPLFPVDMNGETIPLEAGIERRAISFTKGCYPGQEIITRVLHRGHGRVAKKLVGLVLAAEQPASAGDPIRAGEREVGAVTSSAWSAALDRPVALGYVHRDFLAPGTAVEVVHEGAVVAATVTETPFRPGPPPPA
jgi:folate-binding protein YgfZ